MNRNSPEWFNRKVTKNDIVWFSGHDLFSFAQGYHIPEPTYRAWYNALFGNDPMWGYKRAREFCIDQLKRDGRYIEQSVDFSEELLLLLI